MEKKSMRFLHKYLGNPVLSFIARFMFQINIADFHCGLRALRKKSFNYDIVRPIFNDKEIDIGKREVP